MDNTIINGNMTMITSYYIMNNKVEAYETRVLNNLFYLNKLDRNLDRENLFNIEEYLNIRYYAGNDKKYIVEYNKDNTPWGIQNATVDKISATNVPPLSVNNDNKTLYITTNNKFIEELFDFPTFIDKFIKDSYIINELLYQLNNQDEMIEFLNKVDLKQCREIEVYQSYDTGNLKHIRISAYKSIDNRIKPLLWNLNILHENRQDPIININLRTKKCYDTTKARYLHVDSVKTYCKEEHKDGVVDLINIPPTLYLDKENDVSMKDLIRLCRRYENVNLGIKLLNKVRKFINM